MYSCLNRHPLKQNVSLNPIISTPPYPHQIQAISWMCSQEGQFVDMPSEMIKSAIRPAIIICFDGAPDEPIEGDEESFDF